ncbi:MAG: hypothetical protein EBZ50_01610 [Alphaproteobacteria bacterium]|nr:hypothetical protein [Alphaproteobacteria bacterium]
MPSWPATLPQFVQSSGYSESLPQQTIESQVDAGAVKVRRRFTTAFRPMQMVIHCTTAQVATFESFYLTDCKSGSLDFTWVNPRTQASKTFRWRLPPPSYREIVSGLFAVSFQVWQVN